MVALIEVEAPLISGGIRRQTLLLCGIGDETYLLVSTAENERDVKLYIGDGETMKEVAVLTARRLPDGGLIFRTVRCELHHPPLDPIGGWYDTHAHWGECPAEILDTSDYSIAELDGVVTIRRL